MKLLDTTFLIDFLNGDPAIENILNKLENEDKIYTTEINVFEIYVGLYAGIKEKQQTTEEKIKALLDRIIVLGHSREGTIKGAKLLGELIKKGQTIEANDCLTAGIALTKGVNTIITRNIDHFKRIKELKVETY